MKRHTYDPVQETGLVLDFTDMPTPLCGDDVVPGNLYRNMMGDYWLVVSITPDGAQILRYNQSGEILGVARYGKHHVREKQYMGHVVLPQLKVMWEPK
jgi:hypothetical protein